MQFYSNLHHLLVRKAAALKACREYNMSGSANYKHRKKAAAYVILTQALQVLFVRRGKAGRLIG